MTNFVKEALSLQVPAPVYIDSIKANHLREETQLESWPSMEIQAFSLFC